MCPGSTPGVPISKYSETNMEIYRINYTFNYSVYSENFEENYQEALKLRKQNPEIEINLLFPRTDILTEEQISKLKEIGNVTVNDKNFK
ncbi:MAG: hypothetical protein AABX48_03715 [Nanoarchaeota archaeon]